MKSGVFPFMFDNESTNNAWLEGIGDTGVNVAISYAPRQSADDSFNLMVASGDYTDIIALNQLRPREFLA